VKRKYGWLLALLVVAATATSAFAVETSRYLNVPNVQQEQTNWCWAGSSLSILNYNRIYTGQCTFVSYVKTGTTSPETCSNLSASTTEAQKGLNYFGVSSTYYDGALSFSTTKTEIAYSRPIYVSIGWLDSNGNDVGGHAVVIDGYYEWTNVAYQEVTYMDPWDATHHSRDYDSFVYTAGDQRWRWGLRYVQHK
jgi:hypothetical protein